MTVTEGCNNSEQTKTNQNWDASSRRKSSIPVEKITLLCRIVVMSQRQR